MKIFLPHFFTTSPYHDNTSPGYGAADNFKVKPKREFVWTNFHCVLCLGICGFTIFWTILLLR